MPTIVLRVSDEEQDALVEGLSVLIHQCSDHIERLKNSDPELKVQDLIPNFEERIRKLTSLKERVKNPADFYEALANADVDTILADPECPPTDVRTKSTLYAVMTCPDELQAMNEMYTDAVQSVLQHREDVPSDPDWDFSYAEYIM